MRASSIYTSSAFMVQLVHRSQERNTEEETQATSMRSTTVSLQLITESGWPSADTHLEHIRRGQAGRYLLTISHPSPRQRTAQPCTSSSSSSSPSSTCSSACPAARASSPSSPWRSPSSSLSSSPSPGLSPLCSVVLVSGSGTRSLKSCLSRAPGAAGSGPPRMLLSSFLRLLCRPRQTSSSNGFLMWLTA